MKKYLKNFRTMWIIIGILAVVLVLAIVVKNGRKKNYVRGNMARANTQRVFDYADVLTDAEEASLEEYIASCQDKVGVDILLITTYEDYPSGCYWDYEFDEYNRARVEYFYENGPEYFGNPAGENVGNAYGYDAPYGDGVAYIDNYNRSNNGTAYSYFIGSGKCESYYRSESKRNRVINKATDGVNSDPYRAYRNMVKQVTKDMSGDHFDPFIPTGLIIVASFIVGLIYYGTNKADKKARKTTTPTTYVIGNRPQIKVSQDVLYDKKTVTYRVETSSSGGSRSGGSHHSSGGHSYSGGGGRH